MFTRQLLFMCLQVFGQILLSVREEAFHFNAAPFWSQPKHSNTLFHHFSITFQPKCAPLPPPPQKKSDWHILPETNSLPMKMHGWKTILSFSRSVYFKGSLAASSRGVVTPLHCLNEAYFDLLQGLFRSSGRDTGDAEDIDLLAETDLYRCRWGRSESVSKWLAFLVQHLLAYCIW